MINPIPDPVVISDQVVEEVGVKVETMGMEDGLEVGMRTANNSNGQGRRAWDHQMSHNGPTIPPVTTNGQPMMG